MPREFTPEVRARRARDISFLVGAVLFVLVGRLGFLQIVRGGHFDELSDENRIHREILRAERGRIFARGGEVLADNFPTFRVTLDLREPTLVRDAEARASVAHSLAPILGREPEELLADIEKARRRTSRPLPLARSLSFEQVAQLEERMDRLPGVQVETESARSYPHGRLACHLLGYLGEVSEEDLEADLEDHYHPGDLIGRSGLEKQYEQFLRGTDGVAHVETDAYGRRTHYFEELPSVPPHPGEDMYLTLDLAVQQAAEEALDRARVHGHEAKFEITAEGDTLWQGPAGAVVAMDPQTGGILALVSRPSFDPNVFLGGISKAEWAALYTEGHPLLNRGIQSTYPPGSTYKAITALIGLEEGVITPGRTFDGCGGGYFYGNRTFGCWRRQGHGTLTLLDAFARSCDVYFYQVGIQLGIDRMGQGAERLRITEKTGCDLPQERAGLVPLSDWYKKRFGTVFKGAALNVSIGQGEVLLSPIQLARYTAAIANGGRLVTPHLFGRAQSPDGRVRRDASEESWEVGRWAVSSENLALIQQAMERVVMDPNGTGGRSRVGDIRVGGKTGTAQNPHGEDHALFICYAPVEDPRIVVAVVVEESGHGGSIAAPIARQVLAAYLDPTHAGPVAADNSTLLSWEGD